MSELSHRVRSRRYSRPRPIALLFAFVAVLFVVVPAHDAAAGDPPWEKVTETDGITIYRRKVPASDVIAFKGDGIINAPLLRVASVVFDTSRATEWIDSLAEARVARRISDVEYIEYDHFAMPFVLTDRDFVIWNRLDYDATTRTITIRLRSVTDPAAPQTTRFVRGDLVSSTFTLTPTPDGKGTHVVGDVHCDPRGSVPKWLVNFFQEDWPKTTFKKLRTQVAKPNIVESPALRKLLTPPAPTPTVTP